MKKETDTKPPKLKSQTKRCPVCKHMVVRERSYPLVGLVDEIWCGKYPRRVWVDSYCDDWEGQDD